MLLLGKVDDRKFFFTAIIEAEFVQERVTKVHRRVNEKIGRCAEKDAQSERVRKRSRGHPWMHTIIHSEEARAPL